MAFQVASIITTTGFATVDFNYWSGSCQTILVLLMFIGACAAVRRRYQGVPFRAAHQTVKKELNSYIHPKSIKKIKVDGKRWNMRWSFHKRLLYHFYDSVRVLCLPCFSGGQRSGDDLYGGGDCYQQRGTGTCSGRTDGKFRAFIRPVQSGLMFDMLAGRLELFPLLILFHPSLWKDAFHQKVRKTKRAAAR